MLLINKKIKNPLISIITVTKNSSLSLQRCIDSVSKQKFRNYEHIIIDGSSTDKTIEIIKNNKKNLRYAESKKDKNSVPISEQDRKDIMKKGSIIVFPSFFTHRVAPVTKGTRLSLVAWVSGPLFR